MTTSTTKPQTSSPQKAGPDFNIHAIVPNGRGTRIGPKVGVMFKNKEKEGYTQYLDTLPSPIEGQWQFAIYPYEPR